MTEEIPLDITGHDERERPDDSGTEMPFGSPEKNGEGPDDHSEPDQSDAINGDSTDEETVEPVEVLVQLAKDNEIDPWDIDIVDVTDKFLDRLDESDLRTSGRALFYASVLLRMKGDAMMSDDDPAEEEPEPWERALEGSETAFDEPDPFATLEREMDRRLERKRARGMPQTLDELVRELRSAERDNWWKESREYDTSNSPGGFQRGTQQMDYRSADQFRADDEPTEEDVTGKVHGEDIEEVIDNVHRAVREQYDRGRKEVLFKEVSESGGSRVDTFLGLLFLSHRGTVRLRQDELFGDLWIQDPNAVTGSGEVAAD